jgi:hypothetical protein
MNQHQHAAVPNRPGRAAALTEGVDAYEYFREQDWA